MRKIALTLGAAVVALMAVQATDAHAGGKKGFHAGWNKHWSGVHFGGPKYFCFWKKKKFFTVNGWYWKKVRICKPKYYWYY